MVGINAGEVHKVERLVAIQKVVSSNLTTRSILLRRAKMKTVYVCPICGSKDITKGMYGKIHCMACEKHPEIVKLATPQKA